MSKLGKKIARERRKAERKAARAEYIRNRDLGACYIKGCRNNGDFTDACRFCDFKVQSCTFHHPLGRQKAKQHVLLKHPTKAIPTVMMGVLRGQSLE
jgi:hypothetical protein